MRTISITAALAALTSIVALSCPAAQAQEWTFAGAVYTGDPDPVGGHIEFGICGASWGSSDSGPGTSNHMSNSGTYTSQFFVEGAGPSSVVYGGNLTAGGEVSALSESSPGSASASGASSVSHSNPYTERVESSGARTAFNSGPYEFATFAADPDGVAGQLSTSFYEEDQTTRVNLPVWISCSLSASLDGNGEAGVTFKSGLADLTFF